MKTRAVDQIVRCPSRSPRFRVLALISHENSGGGVGVIVSVWSVGLQRRAWCCRSALVTGNAEVSRVAGVGARGVGVVSS